MTKDLKIDGEITCFEWDEALQEWTASFTQSEIKGFIQRVKERIRKQTLEEVLKEHDDNYQKGESYEVLTHYGYKWLEQKIKELSK